MLHSNRWGVGRGNDRMLETRNTALLALLLAWGCKGDGGGTKPSPEAPHLRASFSVTPEYVEALVADTFTVSATTVIREIVNPPSEHVEPMQGTVLFWYDDEFLSVVDASAPRASNSFPADIDVGYPGGVWVDYTYGHGRENVFQVDFRCSEEGETAIRVEAEVYKGAPDISEASYEQGELRVPVTCSFLPDGKGGEGGGGTSGGDGGTGGDGGDAGSGGSGPSGNGGDAGSGGSGGTDNGGDAGSGGSGANGDGGAAGGGATGGTAAGGVSGFGGDGGVVSTGGDATSHPDDSLVVVQSNNYGHEVGVFRLPEGTEDATSPIDVGSYTGNGVVTADGAFAYWADPSAGALVVLSLDATTGLPTPLAGSPFATGGPHRRPVINQDATYLVITEQSSPGNVAVLSLNADGTPTAVANSPFTIGNNLGYAAFAGDCLYIPGMDTDVLYAQQLGSDGEPTALDPASYEVGDQPGRAVTTPDGEYVYVGTGAGIYGFAVSADCSLTALAGSPFETDLSVHDAIFVHPSGECLLTSPGIQVFDVDAEDGGLTYLPAQGVDLESGWDLETLSADGDIAITLSHSSSGDSFGVYAFDATTRTITERSYSPVQTPYSNYGSLLLVDVP